MQSVYNITLIECEDLFRESFTAFLESHPGFKVVLSLPELSPETIININLKTDLVIFGLGGINNRNETILDVIHKNLKKEIKTIALCGPNNILQNFLTAKHNRINAFFVKNTVEPNKIIETIRFLKNGAPQNIIVEDHFGNDFIVDWQKKSKKYAFSEAEKRVIEEVLKGKQNQEVAAYLKLSVRTIESHRRKIRERTGTKTMIGAIIEILNSGYLFTR